MLRASAAATLSLTAWGGRDSDTSRAYTATNTSQVRMTNPTGPENGARNW